MTADEAAKAIQSALEAGPTPGEWRVRQDEDQHVTTYVDPVENPSWGEIACVYGTYGFIGDSGDVKSDTNARLIAAASPAALTVLLAERKALRGALQNLLAWAEHAEVQIDAGWGDGRNLAEMEKDGDLSDELIAARAALGE